jgi:hypothetical protein
MEYVMDTRWKLRPSWSGSERDKCTYSVNDTCYFSDDGIAALCSQRTGTMGKLQVHTLQPSDLVTLR